MQLFVGLEAIGEADDKGMRTVMTTLNGQLRPVFVRDRSIEVDARQVEKADTSKPGQVAAPFSGVVTLKASVGDTVTAGQPVASIEAMKMEAAITSPVDGVVERIAIRRDSAGGGWRPFGRRTPGAVAWRVAPARTSPPALENSAVTPDRSDHTPDETENGVLSDPAASTLPRSASWAARPPR